MQRSKIRARRFYGILLAATCIAALPLLAQDLPNAPSSTAPVQEPQTQDKQEKQAPTPDKPENSNPAQALADKTKEVTAEAVEATKNVGQKTLKKVRSWEKGAFLGPYGGRHRPLAAPTADERWQIYLEQTLTTPGPYLKRMFGAGVDQARGEPSAWGGGWGGYSKRFASREGQFIAANSLSALGDAAMKYEPRYDQCRCTGFWPRTKHAIMRNFLTYDETERHLRPHWARYGGSFGGGMVSAAWKPDGHSVWAEGGQAVLGQVAYGTLLNVVTEFRRDVNRKLGGTQ